MVEPVTEPVPVVPATIDRPDLRATAPVVAPVPPAVPLEPQQRFTLGPRIGAGNHGVVFRARDHQLGRDVAIKRFSHFLADDPRAMHRIRREVETLARVSHPNVVTVHDLVHMPDGDGEVTPHLVMELVEGTSLRDLLAQHGPSPRAVPVVLGVLDGLVACHRAAILHLDIKPANVLVTAAGGVKIVDFGISRAASDATATVAGTPHYMAPEQYEGRADQRSDVYSVGCVLFECLTGRAPFGGTMASQLLAHRHEPRPDPRAFSPWVGPGLASVVVRAMAIDPAHRYASVDEMLWALSQVAHDVVPVPTRPPVTVEPRREQPVAVASAPGVAPALPPTGPVVRRADRVRWLTLGALLSAFVVALVPGLVWSAGWLAPGQYRPRSMDDASAGGWWLLAVTITLLLLALRARTVVGRLAGPSVGSPHPQRHLPRETRRGVGLVTRSALVGSSPLLFPLYVALVAGGSRALDLTWPGDPFASGWSVAWLLMPLAACFLAVRGLLMLRPRFGAFVLSVLHLASSGVAVVLFAAYPLAS